MKRTLALLFMSAAIILAAHRSVAADSVSWQTDYHAALEEAGAKHKFALVHFVDPRASDTLDSALESLDIRELLATRYVTVKLSITAVVTSQGQTFRLLDHPSFADLAGRPGLALVDMTDAESPLFRQVVSIYPLAGRRITPENLAVLLTLPRGTLTQRTLIYAVRTHPEHPASTEGHLSQLLTRETENHAWHQATIGVQGHHHWDVRFHSIAAKLPGNVAPREVCAESWPGQSLLEAAEDCVHSWRQSPGHWEAVSSRHALFAYDMKRGANGIWYATGIFAGR